MRKYYFQLLFQLLLPAFGGVGGGFVSTALAQRDWLTAHSNLRSRTVHYTQDTVQIDSLTAINMQVLDSVGQGVDSSYFYMYNHLLIWRKPLPRNTSYRLVYRVLPFDLSAATVHKDTAFYLAGGVRKNNDGSFYTYNPYSSKAKSRSIFDAKGIDYSGSLARGISVGNAQDLVLNSQFNLQLNGKLGDDIEILGSISDQNIPLQPEGNTQQLQQFDKIFVQIKRKRSTLTVGDYELIRPPTSYFMNYNRRLQGISAGTTVGSLAKNGTIKIDGGAAVSRGKFVQQKIVAQEGNQGPYKLTGANGERFLIVLAGTERVYIDGILLRRGQENDYIINYNSGEIAFTPKQIITKDKRITVEFTYSEQSYLRFATAANVQYDTKQLHINAHLFSESDSKNQSAQQTLSDPEQQRLRTIGDSLQYAFVSGVKPISGDYNAKAIQYAKVDTLVRGTIYSIIKYSTNAATAKYTAAFIELGQGKGNYRINTFAATNGRVYEWVAPDSITHLPQGSYEPITQLIAPKQQQLYTIGGSYDINKQSTIQAEIALSNKDINTFSTRDKGDNMGLATRVSWQSTVGSLQSTVGSPQSTVGSSPSAMDSIAYSKDPSIKTALSNTNNALRTVDCGLKTANCRLPTADCQLKTGINYEYVQKTFVPLDPYRNLEFQRDWNTTNLVATNEHLLNGNIGLAFAQYGAVNYELSALFKDSIYNGVKHNLTAKYVYNNWDINGAASYLTSETTAEHTEYIRPHLNIIYTLPPTLPRKAKKENIKATDVLPLSITTTQDSLNFVYNFIKNNLDTIKLLPYPIKDNLLGVEKFLYPLKDNLSGVEKVLYPSKDNLLGVEKKLYPSKDNLSGVEKNLYPSKDNLLGVEKNLYPSNSNLDTLKYLSTIIKNKKDSIAFAKYLFKNQTNKDTFVKYLIKNYELRLPNNKQQTINNKQQTPNNKQPSTNNQQQIPNNRKNSWGKLGVYMEGERNARIGNYNDSLRTGSAYYYLYKTYWQSSDTAQLQWNVGYQHRIDNGLRGRKFAVATIAEDLTASGQWQPSPTQSLRFNLTYRQLQITDSTLSSSKLPQNTYLGRIDYKFTLYYAMQWHFKQYTNWATDKNSASNMSI